MTYFEGTSTIRNITEAVALGVELFQENKLTSGQISVEIHTKYPFLTESDSRAIMQKARMIYHRVVDRGI